MKTLEEIKDEVAQHLSDKSWDELINHDYEYGLGISKIYGIHDLWEKVTKEYAEQYGQDLLQKVANSEHTFVNGGSIVTFNEAEKIAILNTKLDLI